MRIGLELNDPFILELREQIRYGDEPDNPALLYLWFRMESVNTESYDTHDLQDIYCSQFRLLLNTYADQLIPSQWRTLCLDNINRPIANLQLLARTEADQAELESMVSELRIISHYFA